MPQVAGDSSALFRVFVNLVQNGLKYHSSYAAPHIAVTAERDGMWGPSRSPTMGSPSPLQSDGASSSGTTALRLAAATQAVTASAWRPYPVSSRR